MQTKNVYYPYQPDRIIVESSENRALVQFPVNVTEVMVGEETNWLAETVYWFFTMPTSNLKERIEKSHDKWLELAKKPEPQVAGLNDVVEALNALTEIVLGGEM